MSFIDSSTASPLAALTDAPAPDEDEAGVDTGADDEEQEAREAKPRSGSLKARLIEQIDDINIARSLDQQTLDEIGMTCVREYHLDDNSRSSWKTKAEEAMKFATQQAQEKEYPWPRASAVIFPLITQAAIQFNARTYPALIQNRNVVKGVVWGSDKGTPVTEDGKPDGKPKMVTGPAGQPEPVWLLKPGEKRERADRIGEHMSWQLLEEMPEWEPQTDQLLSQLPVIGGAIRKTYRDEAERRNRSLFVSLMNLVWAYDAPSFEAAPRHTELLWLYPHEIREYERVGVESDGDEGMFLALPYGPGEATEKSTTGFDEGEGAEGGGSDQSDPDAPHLFIEQHRRLDLDDDGYAEPYVVTVHLRSAKVVRIVARYDEDGIDATRDGSTINRIQPVDYYTLIPFMPNTEGGSYPMGFGHLLRPLNEAINTTLNQMFDAGHLQNAGGGFVSDQLGAPSGPVNFQVGKFVRVTTKGQAIRDSVFPIPFQGPSPVLFQLLGVLMGAGKEVAAIQDVLAGDASIANAPPTTVLALIEQGMKVYTAIHKRVYRAFKSEFQKLYRLNRIYLTDQQKYRVGDEWREITPDDYRLGGGVEPIADPTMITDMQRLGRAQVVMTFKDDPLINQVEIRRRLLEAANVDRIDELMSPPDPQAIQEAEEAKQIAKATAIAELSRTRAAELKDQTQAFLNLAMAHAKASGPDQALIETQMQFLRLRIEALNTTVKAAAVDAAVHGHEVARHGHNVAALATIHGHNLRATADEARSLAASEPAAPGSGPQGDGFPTVAPSPGDQGLPPVPAGSGQELPGLGGGPAGGGDVGPDASQP